MAEPNSDPPIRVGEALKRGWAAFIANPGPFLGAHILFFILTQFTGPAAFIVAGPLWLGLCKMSLAGIRGEPVRFEDLFYGFKRFVPTLLAGLIVMAMAFVPMALIVPLAVFISMPFFLNGAVVPFSLTFSVGLTLSLVPLCIVTVLYAPSFFYLYDEELDWWPTLERSRKAVLPDRKAWVNFWLVVGLIHLACSLTCCGAILALPWLLNALAVAYEQVNERAALDAGDEGG